MNKTEKLKERIETLSENSGYYQRTPSDTASRILQACKEEGLKFVNLPAGYTDEGIEEIDI